jgi:DNA polymerase-1
MDLELMDLSQRLNIPRQQSKEIIENYFEKYSGIKKYIDLTIESCREKGYAETLMGRRRYFPDINSNNHNLRSGAERGAINMPIQGSAADMMKLAMVSIHREMKKLNMKSLMTVQVHDELIFDAKKDELSELSHLVKEHMENALPLGEVPVIVDTGEGENWFEAH